MLLRRRIVHASITKANTTVHAWNLKDMMLLIAVELALLICRWWLGIRIPVHSNLLGGWRNLSVLDIIRYQSFGKFGLGSRDFQRACLAKGLHFFFAHGHAVLLCWNVFLGLGLASSSSCMCKRRQTVRNHFQFQNSSNGCSITHVPSSSGAPPTRLPWFH